jgi:NAD(P)-dependent dehydrogenase (short-subunit alcohol dehydrogenase family)
LETVAEAIRTTAGVEVVTLVGDAGLEATQKALVDLALSKFGALHIAFNNAGQYNTVLLYISVLIVFVTPTDDTTLACALPVFRRIPFR